MAEEKKEQLKKDKVEKPQEKKPEMKDQKTEKKPVHEKKQEKETKPPDEKKVKKPEKTELMHIEGIQIFGKYEPVVDINDIGLRRYISVSPRLVFHTQGRHAKKKFRKADVSIVERLINSLMRSGSSGKFKGKVYRDRFACGKKMTTYTIVKQAFDVINKRTKKNPLEILVRAIENSAPREETTRVKYGGITYHLAVDVSPQRRVDFALHNISLATVIGSFNNKKTAAQSLADELISAASNDPKSLAIAKKDEIERVARSAR